MTDQTIPDAPLVIEPVADTTTTALVEAIKARYAEAAESVLATIPKHLQPLVPKELDAEGKLRWFAAAQGTGIFGGAGTVPVTDRGKPSTTPKVADLADLPPLARMARGYRS
jgi:hypothetical protein